MKDQGTSLFTTPDIVMKYGCSECDKWWDNVWDLVWHMRYVHESHDRYLRNNGPEKNGGKHGDGE